MKILVIADVESKSLWDHYLPEKLEGIDLIISCGDLSAEYLEFLATMVKIPILYVPGNHDHKYVTDPPGGCECIDGKIYKYRGLRIMGFGGSMRYKEGPYMYTEKQMRFRLFKSRWKIMSSSGIDILVTHAPAKGYGDMSDLPHTGFECFNKLLFRFRPAYMVHGHVHANYGSRFKRIIEHPSGTCIINAYEKYVLEIDEEKLVSLRHAGNAEKDGTKHRRNSRHKKTPHGKA